MLTIHTYSTVTKLAECELNREASARLGLWRLSSGYWVGAWPPSLVPLYLSPGYRTQSHLDLCPLCPEKSVGIFSAESLFLDLVQMTLDWNFWSSYCSFSKKNKQWIFFSTVGSFNKSWEITLEENMPYDFYTINCKRTSKIPKYFNLKIPHTLLLLLNFYIPSVNKEAEGLTETLKTLICVEWKNQILIHLRL